MLEEKGGYGGKDLQKRKVGTYEARDEHTMEHPAVTM